MKNNEKDTTLLVSVIIAVLLSFPIWGALVFPAWGKPHYVGEEVEGHDAQYWYEQFTNARKESILWRNIAHQYWQYRDYDFWPDSCAEPLGRHNFFDDCISETDTYDKLYELLDGDFEDFFTDWDDHHEETSW
jgi:hypothetical protein